MDGEVVNVQRRILIDGTYQRVHAMNDMPVVVWRIVTGGHQEIELAHGEIAVMQVLASR